MYMLSQVYYIKTIGIFYYVDIMADSQLSYYFLHFVSCFYNDVSENFKSTWYNKTNIKSYKSTCFADVLMPPFVLNPHTTWMSKISNVFQNMLFIRTSILYCEKKVF